jgi:mRNA interferase MazF
MTIASRFDFGDVVLVPFPFTDQSGTKKRPAVVVSIVDYNTSRRDIVIMAITSQVRAPLGYGEATVDDWRAAGLIKASLLLTAVENDSAGRSKTMARSSFDLP